MTCGDSTTNRPLQFRFPASDYVPPVPDGITDAKTADYLRDLRKQLARVFDATRTVTQDIQAPVVLQVNAIADQALSAATAAKVAFGSVRYDTHKYWSPTNYRFNPRVAGFYRISWSVAFAAEAGADNLCFAQLLVSGRADVKAQAWNGSATQHAIAETSTNLYLDGDSDVYIEIWATSAEAVSIIGDPALTFLAVDYVGDIHAGALSGSSSVSGDIGIRISTDNDSPRGQKPPPPTGEVVVTGLAPTVIATAHVYSQPAQGSVAVTGLVPAYAGELELFADWTPPLTALYSSTSQNSLCAVANGGDVDIVTYLIQTPGYNTFDYTVYTYSYDGTLLNTATSNSGTLGDSDSCGFHSGSNTYIAQMYRGGIGDPPTSGAWCNNGSLVTSSLDGPSEDGYYAVNSAPCLMGSKVYAVSGDGHVTSWAISGGDPASTYSQGYQLSGLADGHSGSGIAAGDDGYLYVTAPDNLNNSFTALYKFDANLNLIKTWHCEAEDPSDPCPANLRFDYTFTVYGGFLVCSNSIGNGWGYFIYKFENDGTLTLSSQLSASGPSYEVISLGNGYCATRHGIIRIT